MSSAGSRALVLLGAACVLSALVAWFSYDHAPAPTLALYVPASLGAQPVGPQTVPMGPTAPGAAPVAPPSAVTPMRSPEPLTGASPETPVTLPSVMVPTLVDSPGTQLPIGQPSMQGLPPTVHPNEKETFGGPVRMLLWGLAAVNVICVTLLRQRIHDQRRRQWTETLINGQPGELTSAEGVRTVMPVSRAPSPVMMADEEPSDKAIVIGAASVGGILGIYLFNELSTGVILASIFAYAATTQSKFGEFSKSSGKVAAKVWDKSTDLNEQYDVLPKAKSATDTVLLAASNLNRNYGITDKIDERLKLSEATDKLTSKLNEAKASVTSKVDDIKTKATSD